MVAGSAAVDKPGLHPEHLKERVRSSQCVAAKPGLWPAGSPTLTAHDLCACQVEPSQLIRKLR